MARHSHWHNIQLGKGKADAKRAGIFAKLAKNITVAAREGGGDPMYNFKLRMAIDSAKAVSLPRENIERAIARAVGGEGVALQEVVYEGFAPGGIAVLVRCLTDNPTRTVSEIKTIASKNGASIGAPGSVMWMFERKGVMSITNAKNKQGRDALELTLIEAGAQDIVPEGENGLRLVCEPAYVKKLMEAVESLGLKADASGFDYVAKTTAVPEDMERVTKFVEALEENDDVDAVFTNEA